MSGCLAVPDAVPAASLHPNEDIYRTSRPLSAQPQVCFQVLRQTDGSGAPSAVLHWSLTELIAHGQAQSISGSLHIGERGHRTRRAQLQVLLTPKQKGTHAFFTVTISSPSEGPHRTIAFKASFPLPPQKPLPRHRQIDQPCPKAAAHHWKPCCGKAEARQPPLSHSQRTALPCICSVRTRCRQPPERSEAHKAASNRSPSKEHAETAASAGSKG